MMAACVRTGIHFLRPLAPRPGVFQSYNDDTIIAPTLHSGRSLLAPRGAPEGLPPSRTLSDDPKLGSRRRKRSRRPDFDFVEEKSEGRSKSFGGQHVPPRTRQALGGFLPRGVELKLLQNQVKTRLFPRSFLKFRARRTSTRSCQQVCSSFDPIGLEAGAVLAGGVLFYILR